MLDSVKALRPRAIVPGHGPVMRDLTYLDTVQRMLSIARNETRTAVTNGLSADSALAAVQLDSLRAAIAGDEKQMRVMFSSFFRRPVVSRVYEEAKAGRLK